MADGLVIKFKASDAGVRPIPNCAAEQPWLSESIDIISAVDPPVPADAKVNVPCRIKVVVSCLGAVVFPAGQVKVQVWVCDYAAGGVGPLSAKAPPYPAPYPDLDPKSGGPTTIAGTVSSTTPLLGRTVLVDWTPKVTELKNQKPDGSFHMCLAANVWGVLPDPAPADGAVLPKTVHGIEICDNKNHGQKNLSILPATGIVGSSVFPLQVAAAAAGEIFELEVREVRRERFGLAEIKALAALDFVDVAGKPDLAWIEKTFKRKGEVGLFLAGERERRIHPARGRADLVEFTAGGEKGHRLHISPRRRLEARLRVRLGRGEEPGAVHAFDVIQRSSRGKGSRRLVGGARSLLVFAPDAEKYAAEE